MTEILDSTPREPGDTGAAAISPAGPTVTGGLGPGRRGGPPILGHSRA